LFPPANGPRQLHPFPTRRSSDLRPAFPALPCAPAAPVGPTAPAAPAVPVAPTAPVGPVVPARDTRLQNASLVPAGGVFPTFPLCGLKYTRLNYSHASFT